MGNGDDWDFNPKTPEEIAKDLEDEEILAIEETYGISRVQAEIAHERQKVYGDPKVNHDGIAQAWAGILQPYAVHMAEMKPLPAHVVALLMAALKMNRMRMVFHEDNFEDLSVYMSFAKAWQRNDTSKTTVIGPKPSPTARLVLRWEDPEEVKSLGSVSAPEIEDS